MDDARRFPEIAPEAQQNTVVRRLRSRKFYSLISLLCIFPFFAGVFALVQFPQHVVKAASANPIPLGEEYGFEWVDLVKGGVRFQKISTATTDITYDNNGWPQQDFEYIFQDDRRNKPWSGPDFNANPRDDSGTYHLSFTGQATLSIGPDVDASDSLSIQNVVYDSNSNTTTADIVVPKNRWLQSINFTQTKRQASDAAGNGLTNMHLYRPGYSASSTQIFTDRFVNALSALHPTTLRTFDTGTTNYNIFNGTNYVAPQWSDRSLPTDGYWNLPSRNTGAIRGFGVPWEYVIQLSNQLHADPWINLPVTADDSYFTSLANLFKNGDTVGGVNYPGLDPSLHVYIELGNENWNCGDFTQCWYANGIASNQGISALQWEAKRTFQIANDFAGVFGSGSLPNTVRPVVMWQYGHALDVQSALLWSEGQLNQLSKDTIYGIGEAPYVDSGEPISTDGSEKEGGRAAFPDPADPNAVNNIIDTLYTSAGQRRLSFIAWQTAASYLGVHQVGYEAGPSLNAGIQGDATRSPRLSDFIQRYFQEDYFATGGDAVNFFAFGQGSPGNYGDWYTFENYNNLNYGKYQGLLALQGQDRPALTDGFVLPWSVNTSVSIDPSQHITGDNHLVAPGTTISIGWNTDGSQEYLLRVPSSGTYSVKLNGTASTATSSVQISVDHNSLGTVQLPQGTAGDSSSVSVTLTSGLHTLLLNSNAASSSDGQSTFSTNGIVVTLTSGGGSAIVPSAPINVRSTSGDGSVALNWENVTTATSYTIKRSTTSGGPYTQVGTSSTNSFTDTGLTNDTIYYYVVTASNTAGESALSPQYRIVPTPAGAPAQPTGVTGAAGGSDAPFLGGGGEVRISWPTVPHAVSYNIKRSSSATGPFTKIHSQYDNIYYDTSLALNTTYYYVVSAVNGNGESSDSSVITLTPTETTPDSPTNLQATDNGNGTVSLKWSPSQWQEAGFNELYNLKRGSSQNGPFTTIINLSTDNVIDYDLTSGNQYCYVVSAVNSKGESGNSQAACVTASGNGTPTPTPTSTPTPTPTSTPTSTPIPSGSLIASDPFSGSAGALNGQTSGTGWAGAWSVQNADTSVPGYAVSTSSALTYSTLQTSGNYGTGGSGYLTAGRSLDVSGSSPFSAYLSNGKVGQSGQTLWVSALLRKDANSDDEASLNLHNNSINWNSGQASSDVAIGYFGGSSNSGGTRYWSLKVGGTVYQTTTPVQVGQTALLVLRIDFASTNALNLYVNPSSLGGNAPGSASAQTTTTTNIAFQSVAYYGGNGSGQSSIDEIRFGTSYGAVTPTN
ncbi:fibronectin type III domain-containing protein [Tengunoibacter tsumagoiensis]|uniref:Fibronectin type-III domain-containing protein n=1 Tax=Tengunoibacter tsumagoiensis TaxID=2014871 RepID=A0A401ZUJ8_9CHLR|nr:fibronectin type III domain-containing protein [Tengunoibacter tsumagoiensis]GCE10589.1 hypothetical protein KTT_04480 [Tengunoibacter tsumagoiensis]